MGDSVESNFSVQFQSKGFGLTTGPRKLVQMKESQIKFSSIKVKEITCGHCPRIVSKNPGHTYG